MPIGILVADQYGLLGPLVPDRLGRIVYQRTLLATDTDFTSGFPGSRTWALSIPQMDTTKGFFLAFESRPDFNNQGLRPSYIYDTAQPNIYFLGQNGADGVWNNSTKVYTVTLTTALTPAGTVTTKVILGFMFA
jgi:hypothetical protein